MKTKGKRKFVCGPINCVVCGFEFTPYTRKAMYCSDACKQLAYRQRIEHKIGTNVPVIIEYSSKKS